VSGLLGSSLVLLAVAGLIGAVDGVYFHLWKYRLYARTASRLEHLLHSGRALLLPLTLWFGYVAPRTFGALVVFGVVELCDFGLVVWDVSIENDSRRDLGGLSSAEYLVHVVATTLHSGAIALAFASWLVASPTPDWVATVAQLAIPGTLLVLGAHLVLLHRRFREVAAFRPAG
jgi:hypothetical protein